MEYQAPPIGERIAIHVFDVWQGPGREEETITGTFTGTKYLADNGGTIPQGSFVGWSPLSHQSVA